MHREQKQKNKPNVRRANKTFPLNKKQQRNQNNAEAAAAVTKVATATNEKRVAAAAAAAAATIQTTVIHPHVRTRSATKSASQSVARKENHAADLDPQHAAHALALTVIPAPTH